MDIGTAKVRDMQGVPHHLIDIQNPDQPLALAEWQSLAFQTIDEIIARGKPPILVGGTMLYVDSIVRNFAIPQVAPDEEFRTEKEKLAAETLYRELLEKDPEAQEFIEPKNIRRIIRALEVMEATGEPFSKTRKRHEPRYEVEMIGLFPQWDELKIRIEKRAKTMFQEGLLDEMKMLREKFGSGLPLLQTLNYKQAGNVLDGRMTHEEAESDIVKATLRYAHRQMSWWRGRKEIEWIETSIPGSS